MMAPDLYNVFDRVRSKRVRPNPVKFGFAANRTLPEVRTETGFGCPGSLISSDDDTNKDANVRRSRSKARRRRSKPKRRGNNISEDNNPEDKTSPAHGKDNNGVSPKRLKSQDQTQAAKRRSNASATTSPTCFQQDGNVPVVTRLDGHTASPCGSETSGVKVEKPNYRRSPFKSSNKSNGSWSATISVWIIVFLILPLTQVQASTAEPQWRQSLFCTKNVSLFNQILTFRNMESREYCSFNSTNAPSVHNCSQLRSWVIVKNEFCVEMLTEGQENMDCRMEYGNNQNGESMSSERGAMLNEEAVMDKLWQYSHPPATHPPVTHPPDRAAEPQLDKDNPDIVKIFLGVLLPAIILALLFGILYKFSPKFRSNVNSLISSLRNCWTNSSRKTDSNANPSAIPLQSVSSTNGAVNGHLLKNNII
ncbi:uncharacterized protein LOC142662700 [Rhinoderma darwinii]|uniref:uncharacterized protein LOC142662700 n=1 Tax=Rhinoderma darwinii TaxID=43563 RepID=UPI003F667DCF